MYNKTVKVLIQKIAWGEVLKKQELNDEYII